jgi:hypothetical protein
MLLKYDVGVRRVERDHDHDHRSPFTDRGKKEKLMSRTTDQAQRRACFRLVLLFGRNLEKWSLTHS